MIKNWTKEEIELITREYPIVGLKAVARLLPGRTESAVKGKAHYLQLRVKGHKGYQIQKTTEMIDAAIKREYFNGKPELKKLAKTWDRTYGWIKWRAMNLGLTKASPGVHCGPWLPEEDKLLEDCLDREFGTTTIYRKFGKAGFHRSLSAIVGRMRTLGLRSSRDWWNMSDVCKALDVEESAVGRWIAEGKLFAQKSRSPMYEHIPISNDCIRTIMWKIKPTDLRKFLIRHPNLWDHRRVRKEVLLDLLCGDEGLCSGVWGATG